MSRSKLAAERLRELFLHGRWIANTNVKEMLSEISMQQATRKVSGLNSIAELTFHIDYYLAGLLQVLDGGELEIKDKFSFDLPPITSEQDWHALVDQLIANAEAFANMIEQLPDQRLDQTFFNEKYGTNLRNIEAIIEHSYYHFGQISLIKKLNEQAAKGTRMGC